MIKKIRNSNQENYNRQPMAKLDHIIRQINDFQPILHRLLTAA